MSETYSTATARLIRAIEQGDVAAEVGYLVGLDRPAMLAPDPAALLAARRREDILAQGHRWRIVNESLWRDLLDLGRERPEQRAYVLTLATVEDWLDEGTTLEDLGNDGWRGNQGTTWVVPILPGSA